MECAQLGKSRIIKAPVCTGQCLIEQAVRMDIPRSIEFFTKAAGQGNGEAELELSECYRVGLGVPLNDAVGQRLHKQSAEHEFPIAMICESAKGNLDTLQGRCAALYYKAHQQMERGNLELAEQLMCRSMKIERDQIHLSAYAEILRKLHRIDEAERIQYESDELDLKNSAKFLSNPSGNILDLFSVLRTTAKSLLTDLLKITQNTV